MTTTGMTPRITLHELTLNYENRVALQDVSLTIEPGALLAVVGPNGAGKSMLIKALAELFPQLSLPFRLIGTRKLDWISK